MFVKLMCQASKKCKSAKMRADMTGADTAAFCIAAIMLAVMIITLLLFLTVVFRPTNQYESTQSSTGGQSTIGKTRKAFPPIFTVFNASLLGMILGSAAMFSSLLLSLPQAHAFSSVRGATLLESFGGTLFESCYCIYTWSRSKCLIGVTGGLYWILTALAVLNPVLFTAQLITGLLFENKIAIVEVYRDVGVASISGMF
ncbi:hypothetical protein HDU80_006452 [Chytriomyces hyalinus]|nr:hypothetical protein HDU80_006452 [Chytriomyces hyalinus]